MRLKSPASSKLAARLKAALAMLAPVQRAVFLAIRDEGVSYGVLAELLGLSPSEVEQAFADALGALDRATERASQHHAIGAILTPIAWVVGLSRRRPDS